MSYVYVGTELDLFATADRWKSYVRRRIQIFLGRQVLEVGAGTGGTTRVLCDDGPDRWICLEPDSSLGDRLIAAIHEGELPDCCEARIGTLADLDEHDRFDTILYMDVLEHIADDRSELVRAADQLQAGGHLIVLAPAHQWLFTPFDQAIGHYRRYTKATLRASRPRIWLSSGSIISTRSGCWRRWATGSFSRARCPIPLRSLSGIVSWFRRRAWSTRSWATRWASQYWPCGERRPLDFPSAGPQL